MIGGMFIILSCSTLANSLTCQECGTTISSYNGIISDGSVEVKECSEKDCGEADGVMCVSGYAMLQYTGKIASKEYTGDVEVQMNMNYFKGCGVGHLTSCETLKQVMKFVVDDAEAELKVEGCMIENCTTDNCNDKKPEEINPNAILDQISCYTCEKTLVDGLEEDSNHACSETNKKVCPLGVSTCMAGNAEATINGKEYITEYRKDCGESMISNCDAMVEYVENLGGEGKTCTAHICDGELCNTQTDDETTGLKATGCCPKLNVILAFFFAMFTSY